MLHESEKRDYIWFFHDIYIADDIVGMVSGEMEMDQFTRKVGCKIVFWPQYIGE